MSIKTEIDRLWKLYKEVAHTQDARSSTAPASDEHIQAATTLRCRIIPGMDMIGLRIAILQRLEKVQLRLAATFLSGADADQKMYKR